MNETQSGGVRPWIKIAADIGPLLAFFAAYMRSDIFTAVAVFIVATAVALTTTFVLTRSVSPMLLFSGLLVFVLGGLTLALHDQTFIYIKPTITNGTFCVTLLVASAFGKRPLKFLFGEAFLIDDRGWMKLQVLWAVYFALLGVANEIIWRNFSEQMWVNYKTFGVFPLTITFALVMQATIGRKHALSKTASSAR